MNKFTAESLAASAALDDRRILVITENQAEAEHTLTLFEQEDMYVQRIRRTNGQQQIDYKHGGTIIIRSLTSQGHRGLSVDTVFLDAGVDPLLKMDDKLSLMACTATSTTGELVRA